jgi:hypothetical protein
VKYYVKARVGHKQLHELQRQIMKTKFLIYIVLLSLSSKNLTAQDFNQSDGYYIFELVILRTDSLALLKNIKESKVFYKKGTGLSKIITDKQFEFGGNIHKWVWYDYSTGDSAVEKVIKRGKNDSHLQMLADYNCLNNIAQSDINDYYFPLPNYYQLMDSSKKMQINVIDRIYSSLQDSLPEVNTIINKQERGKHNIIGPYWPWKYYNDSVAKNQVRSRFDTSYVRDMMVIESFNKDSKDSNINYWYKQYYLKGRFKKNELATYKRDTLSTYFLIDSEYDKKNRLVYYTESSQDIFRPLTKIVVKTFTYKSNGNRVETVSRGWEDKRIIDELSEYNKSNQLIRWVKYYNLRSPVDSFEEKINYNDKGLQIKSTNYWNGQFVSELRYKYNYYPADLKNRKNQK